MNTYSYVCPACGSKQVSRLKALMIVGEEFKNIKCKTCGEFSRLSLNDHNDIVARFKGVETVSWVSFVNLRVFEGKRTASAGILTTRKTIGFRSLVEVLRNKLKQGGKDWSYTLDRETAEKILRGAE